MFSQVSVCPGGLPHCMLGYTPPLKQTAPPRADTPLGRHPPGRYPSEKIPPWAGTPVGRHLPPPVQCMLGYGQQTGGTHPNGMQSY